MNLFKDLAPAIKKETKRVGIFTFSGVVVMWIVFVILHACMPEKVPFDYTVILGGFLGGKQGGVGKRKPGVSHPLPV